MKILISIITLFIYIGTACAQHTEMQQDMLDGYVDGDKCAVVTVHPVSDSASDLPENIVALNNRMREHFEAWDFYTTSALATTIDDLHHQGYTHLLVQPYAMIDNVDVQNMNHNVNSSSGAFKCVRVGTPILHDAEDYIEVLSILRSEWDAKNRDVILVCDGDVISNCAQYAMLDYMIREAGIAQWHVAVTNGYPTIDHVVRQLKADKKSKKREICLMAFSLLPCSDSVSETMEEWCAMLRKAGYSATVLREHVGVSPKIQNLVLKHAIHAKEYRTYTAKELKFRNAVIR